MKIAILGAGAMGMLFGGRLAETGHAVTLIDVNRVQLQAIARDGLRLETREGERTVRGLAVALPEESARQPRAAAHAFDLMAVFTKTMHTEAALAGVRDWIGPDTWLMSLQNGLGNLEHLMGFVPRERILVGMTTWPADVPRIGCVVSHGPGEIHLMSADGQPGARLDETVAALDGAGLNCVQDAAIWSAIWAKVAVNASLNTLCSVVGCTVGQLGVIDDGHVLAHSVVAEVAAVARACGHAFDEAAVQANVVGIIDADSDHQPSMYQDMLAGRPTEIESINGAVVREARRQGLSVPNTEMLLRLVRLKEARARGG